MEIKITTSGESANVNVIGNKLTVLLNGGTNVEVNGLPATDQLGRFLEMNKIVLDTSYYDEVGSIPALLTDDTETDSLIRLLEIAIDHKDSNMVSRVLHHYPEIRNNNLSMAELIVRATLNGDRDSISALTEFGMYHELINYPIHNKTALDAALGADRDTIKLLVRDGADITADTLLKAMDRYGADMVDMMLDCGRFFHRNASRTVILEICQSALEQAEWLDLPEKVEQISFLVKRIEYYIKQKENVDSENN